MAGFKKKGSITVEAVFVVPLCLMVCLVLLQMLLYLHHVSWYTAVSWECVLTQLQNEEEETALQRWERIKGEQPLPIGEVSGQDLCKGQTAGLQIHGKMQSLFGFSDMEFSVETKKSSLRPARLLRMLRRIDTAIQP